jgi:hypothetical protein
VVAALSTTVLAYAHDVQNPFTVFDPSDKLEKAVEAFRMKAGAAGQAGVPDDALDTARFVVLLDLAWDKPDISVCFWNGTKELQDWVMDKAKVWSDAANLHFNYQTDGKTNICKDSSSADIRINLDKKAPLKLFANQEDNKEGDWSYIGRGSLNPKFLVSLSIPDVDEARESNPIWAVHATRHEFGHALGLMHEHQRDACSEWFNLPYIAKKYGWSLEMTKNNIGSFDDQTIQYLAVVGDYDQQSIMQYNFSKDMFIQIPGKKNPCYREKPINDLSAGDIEGIRTLYGAPEGTASTAKRSGAASMAATEVTPDQAKAMRADLEKVAAGLPTDVSPTARSSNGTALSPKAAFDEVLAAMKDVEAALPPH